MTATLILVVFAVLALGLFLVKLPGSVTGKTDEAGLIQQLQTVDLEAFRNLIDPDEEQFLRANLPPPEFRAVQRQQMRAAADYVAGVSRNAAILLRLGMAARRSPEPRIAEAGRHLVDNALRLRLYSLMAAGKLYARIAFPGATLEPVGIVNYYQEITSWAALLGHLQHPDSSALVSRAL